MPTIMLIAVIGILFLQATGAIPPSSVGGPMTIALAFLLGALAVGKGDRDADDPAERAALPGFGVVDAISLISSLPGRFEHLLRLTCRDNRSPRGSRST